MAHNKISFPKSSHVLSVAIQAHHLKQRFPESVARTYCNSKLSWFGRLQPSILSRAYEIRMDYRINERPDVRIVAPVLQKHNQLSIPHLFSDGTLCLFRYKYYEFDGSLIIADTIIPWTSLWLYYYEIWLFSGEWLGLGEHPCGKSG